MLTAAALSATALAAPAKKAPVAKKPVAASAKKASAVKKTAPARRDAVKSAAKPLPRKPAPPAKVEGVLAPVNLGALLASGQARVTHPQVSTGAPAAWFDSNTRTFATVAAPAGASSWTIELKQPLAPDMVEVQFAGENSYRWSLQASATAAGLASAPPLIQPRPVAAGNIDQAGVKSATAYRFYRLDVSQSSAAKEVALAEFTLWSHQQVEGIGLEAMSTDLAMGGALPLKATADLDRGGIFNVTRDAEWEIVPASAGEVDAWSRFVAREPGRVTLTAGYEGRRSKPLVLDIAARGLPDWDVTHIERQPRLSPDEQTPLKEGQNVFWFAHVKNYGTADAADVRYEWRIDGKLHKAGRLPKIARFKQTEALLTLPWDGKHHDIEIVVDPDNEVQESCKGNNRLAVRTDSIPLGFWTEDSVIRHFHAVQKQVDPSGNSFEDWAQRQVAAWNAAAATSQSPVQYRLDRLIIVGDGMLPLYGNHAAAASDETAPDTRDETVHQSFGVPTRLIEAGGRYAQVTQAKDSPLFVDTSLPARLRVPAPAAQVAVKAPVVAGDSGD